MSTTGRGRHSVLRIFKGRRGRTGHHATCGALPAAGPYLRLSRFQGGQAVKHGSSMADGNEDDEYFEQKTASTPLLDSESNEIRRFELLRNELMELEKRVQKSADQSNYEEEKKAKGTHLVQKKESIVEKSLDKLRETSTDVWQGTQLLAIDVAAAMGLLRRVVIGDELTEKEKQALRRTLTDLASVIPIGFLMLLPVTAVGHAAMLAAIQRYVPSLIPSTYGPERLELLRQLEKVKELEDEVNPKENVEEKP